MELDWLIGLQALHLGEDHPLGLSLGGAEEIRVGIQSHIHQHFPDSVTDFPLDGQPTRNFLDDGGDNLAVLTLRRIDAHRDLGGLVIIDVLSEVSGDHHRRHEIAVCYP